MAAEEQLGHSIVDKYLNGIKGMYREVLLFKEARELSPDPPVPH